MNPLENKNKFERIVLLKAYGLNTPEQITIRDLEHWKQVLQRFNNEGVTTVSIRTWKESADPLWASPHYPNIPIAKAAGQVAQLLEEKYIVSVTKGINPTYTCVCGTVLKKPNGDFYFEIIHGPGTVRRVMMEGTTDLRLENPYDSDILRKVMEELTIHNLPADTVYEWSWYHIKIGYKKENLVFWEAIPFGDEKDGNKRIEKS